MIPRGGERIEYNLANKIKDLTINLLTFLKKKEFTGNILAFLFAHGRLIVESVLSKCNIKLNYIIVEGLSPTIIITACTAG